LAFGRIAVRTTAEHGVRLCPCGEEYSRGTLYHSWEKSSILYRLFV